MEADKTLCGRETTSIQSPPTAVQILHTDVHFGRTQGLRCACTKNMCICHPSNKTAHLFSFELSDWHWIIVVFPHLNSFQP